MYFLLKVYFHKICALLVKQRDPFNVYSKLTFGWDFEKRLNCAFVLRHTAYFMFRARKEYCPISSVWLGQTNWVTAIY